LVYKAIDCTKSRGKNTADICSLILYTPPKSSLELKAQNEYHRKNYAITKQKQKGYVAAKTKILTLRYREDYATTCRKIKPENCYYKYITVK
jgi:hypothetical protein